MKNKQQKKQIILTPEEHQRLKEINEKQRIRNEFVAKRRSEILADDGIIADFKDLIGIYNLQFWLHSVNFMGALLQKIQDIFNSQFIKAKDKFWYKNIFVKYDIPKELPMSYVKDGIGRYKFIIPQENEQK